MLQTKLFDATSNDSDEHASRRVGRPRVQGVGQMKASSKIKYADFYRSQDRERTRRRYQRRREWFVELKRNMGCQICGHRDSPALEFHHIDPAAKTFAVGLSSVVRSRSAFLTEMSKCALLCSNCHRSIHLSENSVDLSPVDVSAIPPMPY